MMITVEDIKKAVERLSPDELAKFRTWWVEVDAGFLKTGSKRKAVNAKVDKLVKGAKRDLRAARRKNKKK